MRAGTWPNNLYGISSSGDYTGNGPHSLDPASDIYPHPRETECADGPKQYRMYVLYDPDDTTAANNAAAFARNMLDHGAHAGTSDRTAYQKKTSPFVSAQVELLIPVGNLGDALPAALYYRSQQKLGNDLDLKLVPDTGCPYGDYVTRSFYAGNKWKVNKYALSKHASLVESGVATRRKLKAHSSRRVLLAGRPELGICQLPPPQWRLYILRAPNNNWAMDAMTKFQDAFREAFSTILDPDCSTTNLPNPEPVWGFMFCMLPVDKIPYMEKTSAMTTSGFSIYMPANKLEEVLSWVMIHKSGVASGYELDALLVPLSGCETNDYLRWSLRAGATWPVNKSALK